MKIYNIGIIGNCCTHGEFVASALKLEKNARIVAGYEENPLRKEGLKLASQAPLFDDPKKILEDDDIDIIAISCNPNMKAYWVEQAASRGKHIFLNKPFCESRKSAAKIKKAVEDNDVRFVFDIIVFRFNPLTSKLMEEVRSGVYGNPINFMSSWGMTFSPDFPLADIWPERLDPPSISGGGELNNMGRYAIDYMDGLFGRPKSVEARVLSFWDVYIKAGIENFGQIIADYGDIGDKDVKARVVSYARASMVKNFSGVQDTAPLGDRAWEYLPVL